MRLIKAEKQRLVQDSIKNGGAMLKIISFGTVGVKAVDDYIQYTLNQPETCWNSKTATSNP